MRLVAWTRAAVTVLCESEFTTLNSLRFASGRGVETIYSALQINKHLTSPHKTCVCMCFQMFPKGIVEITSSQIRARCLGASNNPVKLSPRLFTAPLCLLSVGSHAHTRLSFMPRAPSPPGQIKVAPAVPHRDRCCIEIPQKIWPEVKLCVHQTFFAARWLRSCDGPASGGQGACGCVVVFYEVGRWEGDRRLSAPQSGIREEE